MVGQSDDGWRECAEAEVQLLVQMVIANDLVVTLVVVLNVGLLGAHLLI